MRISDLTDEALEQIAADHTKAAAWNGVDQRRKDTALAYAGALHELLDRRRAAELRTRTAPAIKLAIAHVEVLRKQAIASGSPAAQACLDMQLSLLKEYDKP